jgi:hypothetical protein
MPIALEKTRNRACFFQGDRRKNQIAQNIAFQSILGIALKIKRRV